MRTKTLAKLKQMARDKADMANSTFIGETELTDIINNSITEVYGLLVNSFLDRYGARTTINITAGTDEYTMPSAVLDIFLIQKLRPNDRPIKLEQFMWNEINDRWGDNNDDTLRYRWVGNKIFFDRTPVSSFSLQIWYVPHFIDLVEETDAFDGINGYEDMVIWDTVAQMKDKEETDPSYAMAKKAECAKRIKAEQQTKILNEPQRVIDVNVSVDPFNFPRRY